MFILCTVTVSILFSSETSEKYKKAREWDIICTNARWISDIMTGESFIKNCRTHRDPRQRMDQSPINHLRNRLNFDLNKSRQKFHHSLKEHHKIM